MGWAPFSTKANWTVKFFCQPFFLSTGKNSAQESASKILCLRSGLLEWPVYSKFWQNYDKIVYSVLIFIEVSIQFFFHFEPLLHCYRVCKEVAPHAQMPALQPIYIYIFLYIYFFTFTLLQSLQRGRSPPRPNAQMPTLQQIWLLELWFACMSRSFCKDFFCIWNHF